MNSAEYDAHTKVLGEVTRERLAQEEKWGQQNHADFKWMAILGEEYGEACEAALKSSIETASASYRIQLRTELLQVAAVAIAHIEAIDRRKA